MTKFQKQMMTIVAVGALSAVTALPAMAETSFYGSARLATFYNSITDAAGEDTMGFDEHMQANSRLGANFKNGDFAGKVEMGFGEDGGSVTTRLMYGTWNFGSGKLLVGQDYTRYVALSNQAHGNDNGNIGYGALWDGRVAQIRVDMNNGFYFAAIKPTGNVTNGNQDNVSDVLGKESYLPKLNLGYAGKAGSFGYNVGVVGQFYKDKTVAIDENVTALMGYFNGTAAFGSTSLMFSTSYGTNVGNMGFSGRMAKTSDDNVSGFEGQLQLSQKLSDTMSANVGVGYVYDKSGADGAKADDKMLLFANMPVKLAKYVTLVPEVSYYDQLDEVGATQDVDNKNWAVGAKWQIDF